MLRSRILSGNPRLENAAVGGPSIKRRPPDDDFDAVQRIQRALREIGYPMSLSFKSGDADGKYGDETVRAVQDFQRHAFPGQPGQWDGRVGRHTLAQMDAALVPDDQAVEGPAEDRIASIETVNPSNFA
ncbi:MAG: peptidoglycan-binding protein [Pseudomonadota bacterium]|nr:peptidoglycan-binding protein [Pseudomonadota bacterium]